MLKMVIPIENFDGMDSAISDHFGRAPKFALIEILEDGSVKSISPMDNVGEHFGGHGYVEELISELKPDTVIARGMGPKAMQVFQSLGVSVYTGNVRTVREAVEAYTAGRLLRLTEPCREARDRPIQHRHP
ncbi:MAG: NifB/NifX family molybdenum-iron cluster-binding protein [Candidatus Bathyarchaeia archaeon]